MGIYTYLIWISGGGTWTGGQAIGGGVGWRSRGIQADEGRGQEVSLGRHAGGRLALVVLESALSFTKLCLEQVNFLNIGRQNMLLV